MSHTGGSRLADLPEVLRSPPRLGPEEAEAFADDLDRIRADGNREAPVDPWAP